MERLLLQHQDFGILIKERNLLGGEDISTVDPEALLKNFSIIFQEVVFI